MKRKTSHDYFFFAACLIDGLLQTRRFGTVQTYRKAIASFSKFLTCRVGMTDGDGPHFAVEDICAEVMQEYNRFLYEHGVIRNSVSFYNRALRSIYNKAIDRFDLPDRRPFAHLYTGADRTRSRAVSEKTISRLMSLDLTDDPKLEFVRDLFVFSFAMRGMAFIDMAFLKKENIHNGYVSYARKKTGTSLSVKIEPLAWQIINRYRGTGEYVFPIITETDPDCAYRQYQSEMAIFNRRLKTLSEMLGENMALSTYVARHSWATAAMNSEIPISVISASLGHSSERITRFYLGSFDEDIIDEANSTVLGKIKKSVSMSETNDGAKIREFKR